MGRLWPQAGDTAGLFSGSPQLGTQDMKFNAYKLVPQEARRNRAALRTAMELAEEFGTSRQRLYVLLKSHEGPSPVFDYRDRSGPKRNWYEPSAVRKWWNALPEEVRHSPKLGKKGI